MGSVTEALILYVKCKYINSPLGTYLHATNSCKFGRFWPMPSVQANFFS